MVFRVNYYGVEKAATSEWIKKVCRRVFEDEDCSCSNVLSIVLVNNDYIKSLNKKFLKRDTPTDVIAFPLNEEDIWAEIYISIDKAEEQAKFYNVTFNNELARLLIHGLLHLLDYDDQDEKSKIIMNNKENEYLKKLDSIIK